MSVATTAGVIQMSRTTNPDDMPFEVVSKDERLSPLQQANVRDCDHEKAYASDKYPVANTRYICIYCGKGSTWPRDLEG